MTKPTRTSAIEIRTVGRDVLVHDPEHDQIHVLNTNASRVLELCDGTRSASDIARSLSVGAGTELSIVECDVEAILKEFTSLKLLQS